jgi:hypothetical protein
MFQDMIYLSFDARNCDAASRSIKKVWPLRRRFFVNSELMVPFSCGYAVYGLQLAFHNHGRALNPQIIEKKLNTGCRSLRPIQGAQVVLLGNWQLLSG